MSTTPSTTSTTTSTVTDPTGAEGAGRAGGRPGLVVGVVVLAVTATLSIVNGNSDGERVVDVGAQLLATGLLYLFAVPRALVERRVGVWAPVVGVVSVLLVVPAFWSGLPLVLGVAAALAGNACRRGARPRLAVTALVCGLLGSLGYAAMYVVDAVLHHG